MMQRINRCFMLYMLALVVSGCAQLGLPQADTFNERLAVGYGAVTEVRTLATTLLNAKKISSADAQNVLAQTDAARAGLDLARSMSVSNIAAAEGKLSAAKAVLSAVQSYLASRQGGG